MSSRLSKTLSLIVYLANTTVLDHTALCYGDVTPCMCALFFSALTLALTSEKCRNTNVSTTPSTNRSILQLQQHASRTKQPHSSLQLITKRKTARYFHASQNRSWSRGQILPASIPSNRFIAQLQQHASHSEQLHSPLQLIANSRTARYFHSKVPIPHPLSSSGSSGHTLRKRAPERIVWSMIATSC